MTNNRDNSVFNRQRYSYHRWWNVPGHIKTFWEMLRAMYQRGKYGFTPGDVWNLSDFISVLMRDSLIYLRENKCGDPIDMGEKEWSGYLSEMAELFDFITKEESEESEKLLEDWLDAREQYGRNNERTKQIWTGYVAVQTEFEKERIKKKDKACDMFKERFFDLWD